MSKPTNLGLIYDPETGLITRTRGRSVSNAIWHKGYKRVRYMGRQLLQHRVAWHIMTGQWPEQIDHINGDRADNRWINLREASHSVNSRNSARRKDNYSGVAGVAYREHTGRYRARIHIKNKDIYLGDFDTLLDAAAARISTQNKMGFTARHGR